MTRPDDEIEDSELDNVDYEQLFNLSFRTQTVIFTVIFLIVTSFFYWFQFSMASNANKKVRQAKTILDNAESAPDELNPLTVELETMVHETEQERDWILDQLTADSFPNQLNRQLQNRFLNETARLRLPPNWKQQLPPNLEQWAARKRQQRTNEVEAFLTRLQSTLDEIEQRIERVETIRENHSIEPGEYGGSINRYLGVKSTVLTQIEKLRSTLETTEAKFDLPGTVFDQTVNLVDPLTKLALHFRGFSALTGAPPAYYHAERLLNDALRIDPQNPGAHYYLGEVYRELNLGAVASEYKIRALKWDPSYKRDTILKTFRNRLQEKPNDSRRRYDLAWALYEVGQKQESKKHLQKVLLQEHDNDSMVKVLARKRLKYIRNGEPPYNKLTNF